MKYAIPTDETEGWNARVGAHFGRSRYYAIWNSETNELSFIKNESEHFGGIGLPAEFLAKHCNGILCSGIGSRAIALCQQLGLEVYIGANGTIKEVVNAFREGKLQKASSYDGCSGSHEGHHYH